MDFEQLNHVSKTLMAEADELLYQRGLLAVLQRYGKAYITGSYFLNTMTWRDLDLYVDGTGMSDEDFFLLGSDIAGAIEPGKMHYRNEFILRSGLPRGKYWGVYTDILGAPWKIDLWVLETSLCEQYMAVAEDLKARMDEESRLAILDIKGQVCGHPDYRKKFLSVDVYDAVLKDGVRGMEGFSKWLVEKKNYSYRSVDTTRIPAPPSPPY